LGFFLDPDGVLGGGVGRGQGFQEVGWEGVELLQADDGGIRGFALFAFGLEVVKDLAAAEEEARYFAQMRPFRVVEHGSEAGSRQCVER